VGERIDAEEPDARADGEPELVERATKSTDPLGELAIRQQPAVRHDRDRVAAQLRGSAQRPTQVAISLQQQLSSSHHAHLSSLVRRTLATPSRRW